MEHATTTGAQFNMTMTTEPFISEMASLEMAGQVLSGSGYSDGEIHMYARDARNEANREAETEDEAIDIAFDYLQGFAVNR